MNPLFSIIAGILDKVIPDFAQKEKAKQELQAAIESDDFQLALAQINVNQAEAQSTNLFVAGWRPSIGWVCSLAFSLHFVFFPILNWFLALFNHPQITIPFDMNTLMTVVMAMLGIGGLRTYEKIKGVA